MCYKTAIINFCDNEGHLKPCNVKKPIAIKSPAWDGSGMLKAVVRCTTQRRCTTQHRGGGKMHLKQRFFVEAPLKYTWNHGRWTSLSNFTTIGGKTVADHVRTSLENDFEARPREAVQVKLENSEARDKGYSDSEVRPPQKRKTTMGLWDVLVSSARSDASGRAITTARGAGCIHGDQGAEGGTSHGGPRA